jgi:hypothetical protein
MYVQWSIMSFYGPLAYIPDPVRVSYMPEVLEDCGVIERTRCYTAFLIADSDPNADPHF